MHESDFWKSVDRAFGPVRGRSLASDLVLSSLDGMTPAEAIGKGRAPLEVWHAMCEAMDLPGEYRYIHRIKPEEGPGLA